MTRMSTWTTLPDGNPAKIVYTTQRSVLIQDGVHVDSWHLTKAATDARTELKRAITADGHPEPTSTRILVQVTISATTVPHEDVTKVSPVPEGEEFVRANCTACGRVITHVWAMTEGTAQNWPCQHTDGYEVTTRPARREATP